MRRGRLLIPVFAVAAAVVLTGTNPPLPAITGNRQPIAYNHRLHVDSLEIACTTCHRTVETGERAGRPALATCLECHESALTENPEEHKIQQYAAAGSEIPWVRLTTLPDDVYFSHRRHVMVAGVPCASCHGAMERRTTPPDRPLRKLTMSGCIDCHRRLGAVDDCNGCHR